MASLRCQYDPIFGKHIQGREHFKNFVCRYSEVCCPSTCMMSSEYLFLLFGPTCSVPFLPLPVR